MDYTTRCAVTVRDVDRGARQLLRDLKKKPKIRVGVLGQTASAAKEEHDGGFAEDTVADVASKHEFGIGVPRRSFIADWADESEPEAKRRLRKAAERLVEGGDVDREIRRFGSWAVGQIQMRISRRIDPPLAQVTIDQKGSDVPLIDTEQLRSSITYDVDDG